ncbi:S53 family peptidase [Frondihabitans cladoniiphilus]|uniref:S53 family peptidase n=2 Tax=Frondihabitans cladoniiphilus TaxID=715785 RepID=A0ABP8W820_9MICO
MAGASGAQAAPTRTTYTASVPTWAKHANDAGSTAATETVEGEVYLPLRDQAGAVALATAVTDPASPSYRKTLSPTAWINTYAPSLSDFYSVRNYITGSGLTITGIPQSRQFIVFRGTADQIDAAFSTSLHTYSYKGQKLAAPSAAPSLPATVSNLVSGIVLDQGRMLTRPDSISQTPAGAAAATSAAPATPAAGDGTAATTAPSATLPYKCSTYAGQYQGVIPAAYGKTVADTGLCGYTGKQLRQGYGIDALSKAGLNGFGQTIGIVDAYASPTISQDVNTQADTNGEPRLNGSTYQQIVPAPAQFTDQALCGGPSGWQGEQTLDVESAHGIAPGAKILYSGGTNCGGGLDLALSKLLDGKRADIISNSYGYQGEDVSDSQIAGQVNLQLQAAGTGIGLYYSSGDSGDEAAAFGFASPDFPASSPWVTAVGGTSIGIGQNGQKTFETGWGDDRAQIVQSSTGALSYVTPVPGTFFYGAGGGTSAVFTQPAYQKGIVPTALASGMRVSPDISAIADPATGFAVGIRPILDDTTLKTGPFENQATGGTSLASPVTAAMIALVQQSSKESIGFANPTLYSLYAKAPTSFVDVAPEATPRVLALTRQSTGLSYLQTLDRDSSLKTAKGYDDVTGLGSISFANLPAISKALK